mmetsp:Transcript_44080/g.60214  ORF Transcript_44080/g.60214 Transcript_44080/m.60214 type:complete len:247 (-) Transcript_44080:331-1071(-)
MSRGIKRSMFRLQCSISFSWRSKYLSYFTEASTVCRAEAGTNGASVAVVAPSPPPPSSPVSGSSSVDAAAAFSAFSACRRSSANSTSDSSTLGISRTSKAVLCRRSFWRWNVMGEASAAKRDQSLVAILIPCSMLMLAPIEASRSSIIFSRSSPTIPASAPLRVSRRSALSLRRESLYSAREVNMRYGSLVPFVTRSSMSTPMYPSERCITSFSRPCEDRPAFAPAMTPCAAASSYPVVPQICPAR